MLRQPQGPRRRRWHVVHGVALFYLFFAFSRLLLSNWSVVSWSPRCIVDEQVVIIIYRERHPHCIAIYFNTTPDASQNIMTRRGRLVGHIILDARGVKEDTVHLFGHCRSKSSHSTPHVHFQASCFGWCVHIAYFILHMFLGFLQLPVSKQCPIGP